MRMEREEKKLIADIKKMAELGQVKPMQIQAKELVRTRNYITKFLQMRAHLNAVLLKIQTVKSHEAMASALKGTTGAMIKMNKQMNLPAMQKVRGRAFANAPALVRSIHNAFAKCLAPSVVRSDARGLCVFLLLFFFFLAHHRSACCRPQIMMDFQTEEMKAEMTMEMMGDTMDEAMEGENDEEEEQVIVQQILDEIGINASQLVPDAPSFNPVGAQAEAATVAPPQAPMAMAEGMGGGGGGDGGAVDPAVSELEARLQNLRRN